MIRARIQAVAFAVAALWAARATPARAQVALSVTVAPPHGDVGDTFIATVHLEVPGQRGPDRYQPPSFDGFRVAGHDHHRTEILSYDPDRGDVTTTRIVHRYRLVPTRRGRLIIGPAHVTAGGHGYRSRRVVVTVGQRRAHSAAPDPPGSDPPAAVPGFVPPPKDHHEPAFLYAVADRHQVFAGDQVTVTWLLYTRTEVTGFEPTPPDTSGLWSRVLEEPERYFSYRGATVGEVRYRVARVGQRALFPLAAGDITVPPLTARLTTEDHPLWPGIEVASAPVTVEVMPLPAGAPAGFDDRYVGQFEITAKVARTEIDAGESFSLTVTVTGDGAIGRTVAPALAWDGFRIRQPRDSRDHIATSGGVVHGSRAYTYWITPERGGAQTLPGIALSFFDPQDRAYKTVKTAPIAVLVRGDPGKIGDPAGAGAGLPEDIRLIHTGAARVWGPKNWLVRFPFLWALVALGPLVFCGVVIGDRVRRGRRRETPRVRLLRARGEARARLKVAEIHLRGDRSEEFYRELSRALLEFLGHQLGRPLSSMTRQKLCAYLGERGFPEPTVAALGQQLESHDQARFAPASPGEAEMRAALRRVRELLRKLERAPAGEEAGA